MVLFDSWAVADVSSVRAAEERRLVSLAVLESGGEDGHLHLLAERFVVAHTPYHVDFGVDRGNELVEFVDLAHHEFVLGFA